MKLKDSKGEKLNIIVEKNDVDTIAILQEVLRECEQIERIEEDSFSGSDFVVYVIPVLTIVFGSQAIKELIKGLMNKNKIKVKFDGFEYEGDYKHLEDAVGQVMKNRMELETNKNSKKK